MRDSKAVPTGKATLTYKDKSFELPVFGGSLGPEVIDIRRLYGDANVFTYDPGFMSTASCQSKITYIDGDEGILLHRGIPIEQLAEKSSFLEVAYLLINGELPSSQGLNEFNYSIQYHTMLNESLLRFFNGFHYNAHPMAMLSGVVASMAAFYHDSMDINNPRHREIFAHRIIAKLPTIAAAAHKHSLGQPFVYPRNDLRYAENFLSMTFAVPSEPYHVNPVVAKAMDRLFIESAGGRRRFLDRLVLGFDAGHARSATRYETAMRERVCHSAALIVFVLVAMTSKLSAVAVAHPTAGAWTVVNQPTRLVNGTPVLFRVTTPVPVRKLSGNWLGHQIEFSFDASQKSWFALAGVGQETKPGPYPLELHAETPPGQPAGPSAGQAISFEKKIRVERYQPRPAA